MISFKGLGAGYMSCIWIYKGELLPSNARDVGSGLATSIAVASFFLASKLSPTLESLIGIPNLFWIFGIVGLGVFVFSYFCIPET